MSRKHLAMCAILGILVMVLSIMGCQGYQAPTYKSPADSDEELEEVEIDVSDLDEEEDFDELEEEDDFWDELDEEDVEEDDTEVVSTPVKSYKPVATADDDEEDVEEDDSEADFTKSPYRAVIEDEDLPTLTVTEGELVKLSVKATDADGDKLDYTYTAPLNSEGKWQTRTGDQGVYYPEITVADGKTEVLKQIKIIVEPKNNKPVLQFIPNVEVSEGDTVSLSARATDADGDKLTYSYSGWMSSSTKTTSYKDSGVHKVTVSVTDGISTVSQEVTVTVKDVNRAPEVEIEF